jgi:hypothetical protein
MLRYVQTSKFYVSREAKQAMEKNSVRFELECSEDIANEYSCTKVRETVEILLSLAEELYTRDLISLDHVRIFNRGHFRGDWDHALKVSNGAFKEYTNEDWEEFYQSEGILDVRNIALHGCFSDHSSDPQTYNIYVSDIGFEVTESFHPWDDYNYRTFNLKKLIVFVEDDWERSNRLDAKLSAEKSSMSVSSSW